MYFSKIELRHDTDVIAHIAHTSTLDDYRLHQVLWQLFKGDGQVQRNFLYRRVESSNWPCFYIVSAHKPVDNQGVWTIQMKDYKPRLIAGQCLAFSLRANPVVTKPGGHGKPVRHDVIMNAKRQLQAESEVAVNQGELIQQAGHDWLQTRAVKHGFRLEQVRVDAYQQHQLRKARGEHPIRFSTVDFNGVLTVMEPEQLCQTLFTGIGPAKGFGCGLLLVRRV